MSTLSYFRVATVTAPTVTDLTTADTVIADWGIGEENISFISRAISRCSKAAEDYCNRSFGIGKYQVDARLERGYRDGHLVMGAISPLMIPLWPIASIVSVVETDEDGTATTLVEGTDYEADYSVGKFYRLDSYQRQRDWWPRKKVTIICWAGYKLPGDTASYTGAETLPAHLEDAIGRMVATRYFERNRNPFVKSEMVTGVGSIDYRDAIMGADSGNLSPDVLDILNNFRQPVVG